MKQSKKKPFVIPAERIFLIEPTIDLVKELKVRTTKK